MNDQPEFDFSINLPWGDSWKPLGEGGLIVYTHDESKAAQLTQAIRAANPSWLIDVVPAYVSVGIFFDDRQLNHTQALGALAQLGTTPIANPTPPRAHQIPCCYEKGLDWPRVLEHTSLTTDAVIALHTQAVYTVYAIGFSPGFPYLGYLPPGLCGVPRLASPRTRLEPGSVGLTGRQTGIYPLPRPGGWNIIGQTPLTIVDVEAEFFPLAVGDLVQFTRIDEAEYRRLLGERLPLAR